LSRPLIIALFGVLILAACPSDEEEVDPTPVPLPRLDEAVVDSISAVRMRDTIDFLAADERGGRIPETLGHDQAREYIIDELTSIGLEPLGTDGYIFRYEHEPVGGRFHLDPDGVVQESTVTIGQDLVALLPGTDPARAWATAPTVPLEDIVAMISVDPVGRPMLPDFAPTILAGTEKSPRLEELLRRTAAWSDQPLLFIQRELIPVFNSDQDAFYEADPPIPGAWLVNPGMAFYHLTTDTAETIDYNVLLRTARWTLEAINVIGRDDMRYPWAGEHEIDVTTLVGAQSLFAGMLESTHLSNAERTEAEGYYWTLQGAIDAEDPNEIPNYRSFIAEVLFFVMREIPGNHPGPVPPPFPG
jgi:hypothetical protein